MYPFLFMIKKSILILPQPATTCRDPPQPTKTCRNPPQPATTRHNLPQPTKTCHNPSRFCNSRIVKCSVLPPSELNKLVKIRLNKKNSEICIHSYS
jgi:hypothetical protein